MNLCNLGLNKVGKIISVSSSDIKRRLMDIGFNKGVIVRPVLNGKSMRAYSVKGSVIAIRTEDASLIEVDV